MQYPNPISYQKAVSLVVNQKITVNQFLHALSRNYPSLFDLDLQNELQIRPIKTHMQDNQALIEQETDNALDLYDPLVINATKLTPQQIQNIIYFERLNLALSEFIHWQNPNQLEIKARANLFISGKFVENLTNTITASSINANLLSYFESIILPNIEAAIDESGYDLDRLKLKIQ